MEKYDKQHVFHKVTEQWNTGNHLEVEQTMFQSLTQCESTSFTVCTVPNIWLNLSLLWTAASAFDFCSIYSHLCKQSQWFSPSSVMMLEENGDAVCVGTLGCAERTLQLFSYGLVTLALGRWAGVKTANNLFFFFSLQVSGIITHFS